MARLKIELPIGKGIVTQHTVSVNMINYGGHLGNDSVLTICQDARIQSLKEFGFSEMDIGGAGIIQTEAQVIYKSEAGLHDELEVETKLAEHSSLGFHFVQRIYNSSKDVAVVKTGFVAFDYNAKKVTKLPEVFIKAFV